MLLGISTRWNASRHNDGDTMVNEISELGFSYIELGYDLRIELVPGIQRALTRGELKVTSVHNYCPIPFGAPSGHPEIFLLSSLQEKERKAAIHSTLRTIEFAASMGAETVIIHAGRVIMRNLTWELADMWERGLNKSLNYDKIKLKLFMEREKKAKKHLEALEMSLAQILDTASLLKINVALENLPSWEAIPNEDEMYKLCEKFAGSTLKYWHDIGHGYVRETLGFIALNPHLDKLKPFIAGMHLHDVLPPAYDHQMPPLGKVNFKRYKDFIGEKTPLILEPMPDTSKGDVLNARKIIKEIFGENTESVNKSTWIGGN